MTQTKRTILLLATLGCAAAPVRNPAGSLAAQAQAFRPAPDAGFPVESRGIVVPAGARLERVLGQYDLRHERVVAAALLPDGRTLVSLGARGDLLRWDVVSRTLVGALPPCGDKAPEALSLAVSTDGRLAAQGDRDGNICVRDLGTGQGARTIEAHTAPVRMLAFTAGGELASYGYQAAEDIAGRVGRIVANKEGGGEVRRWRPATGERTAELTLGPVDALAVSRDGARVVAVAAGRLRAFDAAGKQRWDVVCNACKAVGFAGADRVVVVESRRVRLVDASSGADRGDLAVSGYVAADARWTDFLAIAADGRQAVTSLDAGGLLFFWDLDQRREARRLAENTFGVRGAAFSPDGTVLATAARDRVLLWDLERHAPFPDSSCNGPGARSLALAPDGKRAVTGGDDGTIRVWDLVGGRELQRFPGSQVLSATFSPDGTRLLVAEGRGTARLIDATTGAPLWSVAERARFAPARFSPDGSQVATLGADEGLTVHEAATGKRLWSSKRHVYADRILLYTPDGQAILSQDQDLALGLWNAGDGRYLRRLGERQAGPWQIAVDRAGKRAVAGGLDLAVLDFKTGRVLRTLEREWNGPLALTRDGAAVFTGESDRTIRLRRLDDGAELARFDLGPSRDRARALALAADGTRLYVATERGVILVLDVAALPASRPASQ